MNNELVPKEDVVEETEITVENSGLDGKSYMLIGGGIALVTVFAGIKLLHFVKNKLKSRKSKDIVIDKSDQDNSDEEEIIDW